MNEKEAFPEKKLELVLALSRLSFLSVKEKLFLQNELGTLSELTALTSDDICILVKRIINTSLWPYSNLEQCVKKDVFLMKSFKIDFLHYDDEKYPSMLKEIFDPPFLLFYRGNPEILNRKSIGVVGTRHASAKGMKECSFFCSELVKKGFIVVSGLANGIDGSAHRGALSSVGLENSGNTVAVLAGGLDGIYPVTNRKLGSIIIEKGGCLISEYSPGEAAEKYRFPQRNRIISGLSEAVVVMECPPNSGSLITADFAIEQNRDLFFHESSVEFDEKYRVLFRPKNSREEKIFSARCVSKYLEDGARIISSVDEVLKA